MKKRKILEKLHQMDRLTSFVHEKFAALRERVQDLEIRMDEATPKFPEVGRTEECQLKDHIKKAMEESRTFHEQIQSEIPKWGR